MWLKGGDARGKNSYSEAWLKSRREEHNTTQLNLGYDGPRHSIEINFRMLKKYLPDTVWLSIGSEAYIFNKVLLYKLEVSPDIRRRGVGRLLIQAIINYCFEYNIQSIYGTMSTPLQCNTPVSREVLEKLRF